MDTQKFLELYQVNEHYSEILVWVQPHIKKLLPSILDKFYSFFSAHPLTRKKIPRNMIDMLKKRQTEHWEKLFSGQFNQDWIDESVIIGKTHLKMGITPTIYISGYNFILNLLIEGIDKIKKSPYSKKDMIRAVNTVVFMDLDLALTSYNQELNVQVEDQSFSKYASDVLDKSVDISMNSNEIAYKNLKLMQALKKTDFDVQNISASTEEMASTIESIQEGISETTESAAQLNSNADNNRQLLSKTSSNLNHIKDKTVVSQSLAQDLAGLSRNIMEEIKAIEDIASQVKVLALNATIEASRAGSAGKGFAVVAREVNKLSEKTSGTTDKIREVIKVLDDKIIETVDSMTSNNEAVDQTKELMEDTETANSNLNSKVSDIARRMEEINQILSEQGKVVENISESIVQLSEVSMGNVEHISDSMNSIAAIEKVIRDQVEIINQKSNDDMILKIAQSDHALWMKTLAEVLSGENSIESSRLTDHTQCRFGKWYYEIGKNIFNGNLIFRNIEEPHKKVHEYGIEAVNHYNKGNEEAAMEYYEKAKKESLIVIKQLQELISVKAA